MVSMLKFSFHVFLALLMIIVFKGAIFAQELTPALDVLKVTEIRGRIVDSQGFPVSGVVVYSFKSEFSLIKMGEVEPFKLFENGASSTITDENGYYDFFLFGGR